jgi:hypothetical protein
MRSSSERTRSWVAAAALVLAGLVGPAAAAPQITTLVIPPGFVGKYYIAQVQAIGGVPPREFFAATPMPPGLAILASGEIIGFPAAAGTFQFTVGVFDANDDLDLQALALFVQPQFPGQVLVRLKSTDDAFHFQESFELKRWIDNTGPPRVSDFYLGLITPSGRTFLFYSLDPALCLEVDPDDFTRFFPAQRNLPLPSALQLEPLSIVHALLNVPLEIGLYQWVAALTDPGTTRVISNVFVFTVAYF